MWNNAAIGAVSCLIAVGGLVAVGFFPSPAGVSLYAPSVAATRVSTFTAVAPAHGNQPQRPDFNQGPQIVVRQVSADRASQAEEFHNVSTFAVVATAAMIGGYLVGRLHQLVRPASTGHHGSLQQMDIAMAAYQSEFATGERPSFRLKAAADDAELKKKIDALKKEAQEKMDAAIEATATKFNSIRTGRATPALLDRIRVDYYGALTPLKQVAGISTPDATTLVISPFDRSSIGAIEKAIGGSDLGLTPSNDGQLIRIKVPPLTEDRRKEMVKQVGKMGEEGKVAIRNVRRDVLKSADKLSLSEDAEAGFKDDIQKATDKAVKKLEDLIKAKDKDLTTL